MAKKPMPEHPEDNLVVFAPENADIAKAAALAAHLRAPLTHDADCAVGAALALRCDCRGLTLMGDGMELQADFTRMIPRLKPGRLQRELLVRAARIKGLTGTPTAFDATAGLGEDSLLLAAAGFDVTLSESDPVIAALLRDALHRAQRSPELCDIVARMHFREADSIEALGGLEAPPDIVYLDPMFPARRKSAQVKKKFQLLHRLERPCDDERELLQAAIAARPRKIVVKRPPKGPYLAGVKPAYSLKAKAVRFDCLVFARS